MSPEMLATARRTEPVTASDQEEEHLRIVQSRRLAHLVERCQRGDKVAQRDLVLETQDLVYRTVYRIVGRNDVDDVTQQVYLQAFRHIDQFQGLSTVSTWMCRIAINESLQHIRQQKVRKTGPISTDMQDFHASRASDAEKRELLESALSHVEPDLKVIFVLREEEGLMDLPAGTVASRIARARHQLREYLTKLGWSPDER
jgi:RNA polymerase sigma-70 factor (ECF subfamily)